jgi:hypothetical protein
LASKLLANTSILYSDTGSVHNLLAVRDIPQIPKGQCGEGVKFTCWNVGKPSVAKPDPDPKGPKTLVRSWIHNSELHNSWIRILLQEIGLFEILWEWINKNKADMYGEVE